MFNRFQKSRVPTSDYETLLRESLDLICLNTMRPVMTALAILYLFFAIGHMLVLPEEIAASMGALALGSSVVFLGLRLAIWRGGVAKHRAHLVGAVMGVLVVGNSAVHLYLTGDPLQTTNFLLIVIGIACVFLSLTWFVLIEALAFGSWIGVVSMLPPSPAWLHFAFAFVTTLLLAGVFFVVRSRNLRRLEAFRLRDEAQKEELAIVLNNAEKANAALEHNNRQLTESRNAAEVANRAKSEFLANMSHEIRTPLNAVIGLADLMLQETLPQEQREHVEMIQTSGTHLLAILNNVLDFAKIEAGRLEIESVPFDVHDTVETVREILFWSAQKKGLQLRCDIAENVPRLVMGDPVRVRQMLLNLTGNAVKFTHEGDVVLGVQLLSQTSETALLHFVVRDTGIGLSDTKIDHIFESFSQADSSTTRQYGGTGLGLSICKRLVEAMGGRIWVESEEGTGSAFQFEISFDLVTESKETETFPDEIRVAPLKVLLAEDNIVNQRVAMRMLEKDGHEVRVVDDGQQAWDVLAKETFALLITDIQMPEMDGLELMRKIRAVETDGSKRQVIVALTANASEEDRARCIDAGADGYLAKPLQKNDLTALLHRLFSKGA